MPSKLSLGAVEPSPDLRDSARIYRHAPGTALFHRPAAITAAPHARLSCDTPLPLRPGAGASLLRYAMLLGKKTRRQYALSLLNEQLESRRSCWLKSLAPIRACVTRTASASRFLEKASSVLDPTRPAPNRRLHSSSSARK